MSEMLTNIRISELQKLIVSDSHQEPQFLRHPENPQGFLDVHGRIHEKESMHGINVGVDKTNFEPVELEKLTILK